MDPSRQSPQVCGREAPGWAQVLFLPPSPDSGPHLFPQGLSEACARKLITSPKMLTTNRIQLSISCVSSPYFQGPPGGRVVRRGALRSPNCLEFEAPQYLASEIDMCNEASGKSLLIDRDIQAVLISESLSFQGTRNRKRKKKKR